MSFSKQLFSRFGHRTLKKSVNNCHPKFGDLDAREMHRT